MVVYQERVLAHRARAGGALKMGLVRLSGVCITLYHLEFSGSVKESGGSQGVSRSSALHIPQGEYPFHRAAGARGGS